VPAPKPAKNDDVRSSFTTTAPRAPARTRARTSGRETGDSVIALRIRSMWVRLLYFDQEVRDVEDGTSVAHLWRSLQVSVPHFARFGTMPAVAVNCEYVSGTRTLSDDDEVAFLPPIAGG
jgi:molybdopterin converting factor small subunit